MADRWERTTEAQFWYEQGEADVRKKLTGVISVAKFHMLADWLDNSPRFSDMTGHEIQRDLRVFADLLDGNDDG